MAVCLAHEHDLVAIEYTEAEDSFANIKSLLL